MKLRRRVVAQTIAVVVSVAGISTITILRESNLRASLLEQEQHRVVDIGIEHNLPAILDLTISRVRDGARIEILQQSGESMLLSLPDTWRRGEVRGARIIDIISEDPTFGFARWTIPPDVSVSFMVDTAPEQIVVHNPSAVPLQVLVTDIDLAEETVSRDVVLILEGTSPVL